MQWMDCWNLPVEGTVALVAEEEMRRPITELPRDAATRAAAAGARAAWPAATDTLPPAPTGALSPLACMVRVLYCLRCVWVDTSTEWITQTRQGGVKARL